MYKMYKILISVGHFHTLSPSKLYQKVLIAIQLLFRNTRIGCVRLRKQAGAELGQAQLKLRLDFTLIFCRFGLSRFGLESCFWMVRKLVIYSADQI